MNYIAKMILVVAMVLCVTAPSSAQATLLNEHGRVHTATAGDALGVFAELSVVSTPNGAAVRADITTDNTALFDNGTGCARFSFRRGDSEISSLVACSERNPGRGAPWNEPTRRHGSAHVLLAPGVRFDNVAVRFFNADHSGEPTDWGRIVRLSEQLIAIIASL